MTSTVDRRCNVQLAVLLSISLFMVIVGGRLLLLQKFSTDIPQFDAWGIEGELYKSYFNGSLRLADFFSPCNEHRVVFTRLLSLGLLLINNLWDNQMQAVVNALFFSATGAIFFWFTARHISIAATVCWWFLLLAIFALPYGWENARWGFQSQFYLLIAFSLAITYISTNREYLTVTRIALTGFLQLATLFTMASGVLTSVAVIVTAAIILVRSWPELQRRKPLFLQITVAMMVVIFWKVAICIPPHAPELKASSLAAFFAVLANCLSWPHVGSYWWWVFSWLPWLVLCGSYLLRRSEDRAIQRVTIGLGIWTLLSAAATAYSRNTRAFHSKYADPLAFSLAVNGMALMLLCTRKRKPCCLTLLFVAAWVGWNGYGLCLNTKTVLGQYLPEKQIIYDVQRYRTQSYLVTGNFNFLIPEEKHGIPDRSPEDYARRLNDPIIKTLLPRSINLNYQLTGQPSAPLSRFTDMMLAAAIPLFITGSLIAATCLLFIGNDFIRGRKDIYAEKNNC